MHWEWGQDGQELQGDDAKRGKSWGLCGMSQHGLRVLWAITWHNVDAAPWHGHSAFKHGVKATTSLVPSLTHWPP